MDAKWIVFAALALVSTTAYGVAAQRTFVAPNGNDINPCSIVQPCRSFGAAIGRTAPNGEVIVLDSAGYGPVLITQSVSIIAPQGVYAGISVTSGQTGVAIDGANIVVALRGLSINGIGAGGLGGIVFQQGTRLRIEGCVVSNISASGIVQHAANSDMVILDTIVRDNGGAGAVIQTNGTAVFDNFRAEHNTGDGVYVVAVSTLAHATIRRSVLSHNGGAGVFAVTPPDPANTRVAIEDSAIADNAADGITVGGNGTGEVRAEVRRNSIGGNGFSGVSVFTIGATGAAEANVAENAFGQAGTAGVSASGSGIVYLSRNSFSSDYYSNFTGAGVGVTYQDNTGRNFELPGSHPSLTLPAF